MAYDFKPFEKRIKEISERLVRELGSVRTGRAAPAILDGIQVESYGTRVPITQVANISVEDARTLRISPWDTAQAKEIEKAITLANLGLSVGSDEKGVRVFFPELTSERRVGLRAAGLRPRHPGPSPGRAVQRPGVDLEAVAGP